MRLNTKTDYCIRILIYLQKHKEKVRIQDIANSYKISKNHLSVAANKLSDLGYIISTPGPKGGIMFNKEFKNKTIGELISLVEPLDMVECFTATNNTCTLDPHCKLKNMISKATNSFMSELKKYKICDLA